MISLSRPQAPPQTAISVAFSQQARASSGFIDELPLPFEVDTNINLTGTQHLPSSEPPPDTMQSETWGHIAPFNNKSGRVHHQRESSLSSVGSTAGPASPFNHNSSNPQIAFADASNDLLSDMHPHESSMSGGNNYYPVGKGMPTFSGYQNFEQEMPNMAYPLTIPGPRERPVTKSDRGLLPPPEMRAGGSSSRSAPTSGASSNAGDSPATPVGNEREAPVDRRSKSNFASVPRLDRTMTDVYGDELYSPNFAITSTPPSQTPVTARSQNALFNQTINAANNQHLSATHSPTSSSSRDRSPFRTGSPFVHQSPSIKPNAEVCMPLNSAQRVREQAKLKREAQMMQQQSSKAEPATPPQTISPKDAMLEFNETDGDANFSLFGTDSTNFDMDFKSMLPQNVPCPPMMAPQQNDHAAQMGYLPPHMSAGLQIPQQYPFISRPQLGHHETPPRLGSALSSSTNSSINSPGHMQRPHNTMADGGTYTCTYHGCTLRFDTPALLQKHKREGHRQVQGLTGTTRPQELALGMGMGMTSSFLNTQAGPHRCDRINPSTGKPCGTIFSRPYDLTRHEDTIHNARKQKVRCDICHEEKTFSRADALTRHYRVCHPHAEVPGKHRRRPRV